MIKRLDGHNQASAYVMVNENEMGYELISYRTNVLKALQFEGGYKITCSGLYSMTTRKHIGWFLKEYFPKISYQTIKGIAYTDDYILVDKHRNIERVVVL